MQFRGLTVCILKSLLNCMEKGSSGFYFMPILGLTSLQYHLCKYFSQLILISSTPLMPNHEINPGHSILVNLPICQWNLKVA